MLKSTLFNLDILTSNQFSVEDLALLTEVTKKMRSSVQKKEILEHLKGKIITALFYEPSSRTFGSFISAAQRLGAGIIPIQGVTYSSVAKGETLVDTIRTFSYYSDAIVLRHPEVGSAKLAAEFCDKPIINAGDGWGEHPSQALIDFFTIQDNLDITRSFTITCAGDLKYGRTVHSLVKLFSLFNTVNFHFISPPSLKIPDHITDHLKTQGISYVESEDLSEVLSQTDVLYATRVQKERFSDLEEYEKLKMRYVLNPDSIKPLKKKALIMHPFPRVGEITMDVDLDPRAMYFKGQIQNGLFVRMALLALVLGEEV